MRAALGLGLAALTFAAVWWRLCPPAPLGVEAPADAFAAARAFTMLARVVGDEQPRWLGSPANAAGRDRLAAELRRLGYEPEVQSRRPDGVPVHNVLARLPGTAANADLVLLCAHHDSVREGPGVADDGAGMAALLETARALRQGPPLRNTILFLITDGEEAGLYGARAFVRRHPDAARVRVVLNFEARGTSGSSLMFETGRDDAWLVDVWARAVPRPVSSSLFASVYRRMPNSTDLTVFLAAGFTGMNFAFIGDGHRYHTAADDLAHLDRGSLQHHGEQALALARAFGDADLAAPPAGSAVWFDVLALGVVRWPSSWSLPLALAVVAALAVRARRDRVRWRSLVRGALLPVTALLLAAALGVAWTFADDRLRLAAAPFVAAPLPFVAAQFGLGVLAFALARRVVLRGDHGEWAGHWLLWSAGAVALAASLPGSSYLLLVPAACAALLGGGPLARLALVPVAGVVWFPLVVLLPQALGVQAAVALVPAAALVALALAPPPSRAATAERL